MHPILNYYLPHLFSGICLLCQEETHCQLDLCKACESELPYIENSCIRCALPLPMKSDHQTCGVCLQRVLLPTYRIFPTFVYRSPIDKLIIALKFRHQLSVATVLGELMANKMQKAYSSESLPNVIIPIPLHKGRLRERGFNQALELARPISRALCIPLDYSSCSRVVATKPQADLPAKDRADNVRNAFTISKRFQAKKVCLVDDVLTTGHTAMALSQSLFKAGVQSIDMWCCARTSSQPPVR